MRCTPTLNPPLASLYILSFVLLPNGVFYLSFRNVYYLPRKVHYTMTNLFSLCYSLLFFPGILHIQSYTSHARDYHLV